MTDHTPTPWTSITDHPFNVPSIMDASGKLILEVIGQGVGDEVDEANARRIVLCVNALAGIESDKLEKLLATGSKMIHVLNSMIGYADKWATNLDAQLAEIDTADADEMEFAGELIDDAGEANVFMQRACDMIGIKYVPIRRYVGEDEPHEGDE
jgi:hypothetical protein